MRAWESAKVGTASQQAKTVSTNKVPNLRVDMWYLPRLSLTLLEHLSDHLVVNNRALAPEKAALQNHGFVGPARSTILWARALTGLMTVESLTIRCRMGTTAGSSCRLFSLAISSMRLSSSSRASFW